MSGEDPDISKENALKTALDFLDGFLAEQNYITGDFITIADFSVLASITQLEAMEYKISSYRLVHTGCLLESDTLRRYCNVSESSRQPVCVFIKLI